MPDESPSQVRGIDVSVYQGKPDWSAVAASKLVDFVYVRALIGTDPKKPDGSFAYNWSGLKSSGLKRGAYYFYRIIHDPVVQAEAFWAVVGDLEDGDLPPMIDVEVPRGSVSPVDFAKHLRKHIERVEALFKRKVIIYTGGPIFNANTNGADVADLDFFSERDLWLAAYVTDPQRYIPKVWSDKNKTWFIWQDKGDVGPNGTPGFRIPGINGVVDHDVMSTVAAVSLDVWVKRSIIVDEKSAPVEVPVAVPVETYRETQPAPVVPVEQPKPQPIVVMRAEQNPGGVLGFIMMFIQFLMMLFGGTKK
jgi:GH25 family lysozyme M1 (1,4-beta-N-acetylmuramidase)